MCRFVNSVRTALSNLSACVNARFAGKVNENSADASKKLMVRLIEHPSENVPQVGQPTVQGAPCFHCFVASAERRRDERNQSCRSAIIGSTRVARRAGR